MAWFIYKKLWFLLAKPTFYLHIADLFSYCYERDVMPHPQNPKRVDLIDKFNDTAWYVYDLFSKDTP